MRNILKIIFILISLSSVCFGQSDSASGKYFSIGSKTTGIGFGNPIIYNGIRLNLWDQQSIKINGISLSFSTQSKTVNGIQISGLVSLSDKINGVSIASLYHNTQKINGFAASFGIDSDTLNGVFFGFGVAPPNRNIDARILNGLAVGAFVGAGRINGISAALWNSYSKKHNGISVSALNQTDELHGLQIGLINYAGNNPKILRWLPIINFHL